MVSCSQEPSATASWPRTRRSRVAKAETRCSAARPLPRSWLPREVLPSMATRPGASRPQRVRPGAETVGKQARIDPVQQRPQPAPARQAVMVGQKAPEKVEIVLAPLDNPVEIVAGPDVPQTASSRTSGRGWATRQDLRSSSMAAKLSRSRRRRGLSAKSSMTAVSRSTPPNQITQTATPKPPLTRVQSRDRTINRFAGCGIVANTRRPASRSMTRPQWHPVHQAPFRVGTPQPHLMKT